jgi:hypothetical protein
MVIFSTIDLEYDILENQILKHVIKNIKKIIVYLS